MRPRSPLRRRIAELGPKQPFPARVFAGYYRWASLCNRVWPWVRLGDLRLRVAPSVYKPIQNEHRVAALVPPGGAVLDVGCGSGVLGIAAAPHSRSVLAIDVNPDAIRTTRTNAERLGISNLDARLLDLTRDDVDGAFDVVLCGPPFSEAQLDDVRQRWAGARAFTPLVFAHAREWLDDGGLLILHHMERAADRLEALALGHGFRLRERRPNGDKALRLHLLALLYAQVGLRTAFYVFERVAEDSRSSAARPPVTPVRDPCGGRGRVW